MAKYKISDELIHYCTKCRLNLNHRVTLVEEGIPKRVLCLTCKTDRLFRASSAASAEAKKAAGKKPRKTKAKKKDPAIAWQAKLEEPDHSSKSYSMETPYDVDDRIKHPTFGTGVVVETISPDKIKIFFPDGTKILKCGKAA